MTARETALAAKLVAATAMPGGLIHRLRSDDELMAELMALCARPGPASNDSDWEYHPGSPLFAYGWFHGGSGLDVSHHLPEPADPEHAVNKGDTE